jgi:ArsR family transcriptional regulator, arsenate/arsenite/antimonite-responsive transcriptional repressor
MIDQRQAVETLGALAQDTRLAIIRLLVRAGPQGMAAGAIAERVGVSPSNLSFHVGTLERAGLVTASRQQRSVIYVCRFEVVEGLARFLLEDCCRGIAPEGD